MASDKYIKIIGLFKLVNEETEKFKADGKEMNKRLKQNNALYRKLEKKYNDFPRLVKYFLKEREKVQGDNVPPRRLFEDENDAKPSEETESTSAVSSKAKRRAAERCLIAMKESIKKESGKAKSSAGSSKGSMNPSVCRGTSVKLERESTVIQISVNSDRIDSPKPATGRITRSSQNKREQSLDPTAAIKLTEKTEKCPIKRQVSRHESPFQSMIPTKKIKMTPRNDTGAVRTPVDGKIQVGSATLTGGRGTVKQNLVSKIVLTPDNPRVAKTPLFSGSFSTKLKSEGKSKAVPTYQCKNQWKQVETTKKWEKGHLKRIGPRDIVKTAPSKKAPSYSKKVPFTSQEVDRKSGSSTAKPTGLTIAPSKVDAPIMTLPSAVDHVAEKHDVDESTKSQKDRCENSNQIPDVDTRRVIMKIGDQEQPKLPIIIVDSNDESTLSISPSPTKKARVKFIPHWAKPGSEEFEVMCQAQGRNPDILDNAKKYFQRPPSTLDVQIIFPGTVRQRPRTSSAIWNDTQGKLTASTMEE